MVLKVLTVVKNILFLPIVVVFDLFKSQKSLGTKIGYLFLVLIFIGITWLRGFQTVLNLGEMYLFEAGYIDKLSEINVRGESMLPSIKDGETIQLHSPKKYGIQRGDIVSFKNIETSGLHYLKRIIGVPYDQISLKNGYVAINEKILKEDYTLNNLPTYSNTFLVECNAYSIPKDHYLVLGDNRTVSLDSRVIGFINKKDIDGVIKTNLSETFISGEKQKQILKATLDENLLLQKVNEERKKNNLDPLILNPVLSQVAKNRATSIKDYFNDWKKKATSSEKLLEEGSYRYNLVHEFVTFGYLDEESIIKQILESSFEEMAFSSKNYTEIGVGTAEITNQECKFPIISIIITWPSNPTYSQEIIDFWANEEKDTKELLAVLQTYVGAPGYDQGELRQLINSVAEASNIATTANQKIKSNEWIDSQQIERYYQLIDEAKPKLESFFKKPQSNLPNLPASQPTSVSLSTSQTVADSSLTVESSKFVSLGQKTIENGATAKINSVWEDQNEIKIKITFANVSNNSLNLAPIRTTMRSQTLGTGASPAIPTLALKAGEVRSLEFSFDKIADPPYRFVYLNSSGESIELGKYNL